MGDRLREYTSKLETLYGPEGNFNVDLDESRKVFRKWSIDYDDVSIRSQNIIEYYRILDHISYTVE